MSRARVAYTTSTELNRQRVTGKAGMARVHRASICTRCFAVPCFNPEHRR